MRRSAAPSQGSSRPRFMVPFQGARQNLEGMKKTDTLTSKTRCAVQGTNTKEGTKSNAKISNQDEVCEDRKRLAEGQGPHLEVKKARFTPPVARQLTVTKVHAPLQSLPGPGSSSILKETQTSGSNQKHVTKGYFNVVWCKRSNKKHKKWEGDAVLVTCGRSVTLYDTEGKEIGKSSGYKSAELSSLTEDETLPIGGKEIQIMSVMTEDQFTSGKCFTAASVQSSNPSPISEVKKVTSKPFSRPMKGNYDENHVQEPTVVKPRHDPNTPGALVMPRPSESHQWKCNTKSACVVDVVVDPYLSVHLRPHQREGIEFLYECVMGYRNIGGSGAILADDMGLGKTLQCISLIWTLLKQGPYGGKSVARRVLIITPGSLVKNWFQEFKKWLGLERLQVFAVSSDKKVEDFMKTSIYPVLIISYEMFVRMYDTIQQLTFDLIVCDEGHRLKNTAIKTTSLIMSLPTRRRIVLTGTPIQNDLQEFFSIVEFCNPGILGSSAAFRRVYEDPIVRARQPGATPEEVTLGEERGAELARMTHMFVLRRTQEINNKYLPPKCEIVVLVRPCVLQLRLYQQLLRSQVVRSCLQGGLSGSPHLVCMAALKQLCNHPSLVYQKSLDHDLARNRGLDTEDQYINSVYEGLLQLFPEDFKPDTNLEEHSSKLAVLSGLLHHLHLSQATEKIVVVSNHTKTLDVIQHMCDSWGYQYLRLDGQTPTSKRQELVTKFNSKYGQEFIFLLSSKAGGVGLNLIGASRLVLYDIDWNPANDLQAMARVWRDGQKQKVHIYRLLTTGTIEEKMYQRQICKQGLSGAIMDIRDTCIQFSLDDLKDLFSVNLDTQCDTHDLLNCDCLWAAPSHVPPEREPVTRPCQLGTTKVQSKKRNLGMDELKAWKHSLGQEVKEHEDWYLNKVIDKISFVLHNEVKTGT